MSSAIEAIAAMNQKGYTAPTAPVLTLPGSGILTRMSDFMDKGISDGLFYPHDKTVAMAVASIVVSDTPDGETVSEDNMFARERRAFLRLAKTPETLERITMLMEHGQSIRN